MNQQNEDAKFSIREVEEKIDKIQMQIEDMKHSHGKAARKEMKLEKELREKEKQQEKDAKKGKSKKRDREGSKEDIMAGDTIIE